MPLKEATVRVGNDGIQFGKAWFSHEKLMGVSAADMNQGKCSFAIQSYAAWLDSILGAEQNTLLFNPEPKYWYPPRDEPEAISEGWCVFSVTREHFTHEIQKDDSTTTFDSDDSAAAFVLERAMQGSPLHSRAIQFCLDNSKHRSE